MVYDPILTELGAFLILLVLFSFVFIAVAVLADGVLTVVWRILDGPDRRKREHFAIMRRLLEDLNNEEVGGEDLSASVKIFESGMDIIERVG
jgi:hypothetical protein